MWHKKMKEIVRLRKTSIKDLAKKTGISPSMIYSILSGERDPSLSTLVKICAALNIQFCDLFHDDIDILKTYNVSQMKIVK